MPFYMESFGAGGFEMGALMAIFSTMQFIFSPFWGEISDRYGRKNVLMVGMFGKTLAFITMGLAQNLWTLYAVRAMDGMISSAILPTAMAYISDSTTDQERGSGMGVIGAAMGMGMMLGPGVGGWLAGHSLATPFFLAAGMSVVSLAAIWLALPESLARDKRSHQVGKFRGPNVGLLWRSLFGPLGFLLLLAFLVNFALASFEGIFGLYADRRYGYGPAQVGSVLVIIGMISFLVQMLVTGYAIRKLGEAKVIKVSLVSSALAFVLMVMAPNNFLVPVTVGFFVFSNAMLRPAISSLTSKKAVGGQGLALGLNNAFQSLGLVVGPLWAGSLFDVRVTLPFMSGAVIMLLAFAFSMWTMTARVIPQVEPKPTPVTGRVGDD
jgi:DHA1 family multidrug resistance protein-like MFS transporter